MSGYRVIVTEHRTRGLVYSDGTTYTSPPHTEEHAPSLIERLAGVTASAGGGGPLKRPAAGGQWIIELERQR